MIEGVEITEQCIRYVFPLKLSDFKGFSTQRQTKRHLKTLFSKRERVLPNFPYRLQHHKLPLSQQPHVKELIYKCKFCDNRLVFEVEPKTRTANLSRLSFEHVHLRDQNGMQMASTEQIECYEVNEPYLQDRINKRAAELKTSLQDTSHEQFSIGQAPKNFGELVRRLRQIGAFVSYQPLDYEEIGLKYPDYCLIITQEMKEKYIRSARSIGIDFTYNIIKQMPVTSMGKKQYSVGFIAALNQFRRLTNYGILIASEESAHYVEKALTELFYFTGKQPSSIVTDQSFGILAGVSQLKKKRIFSGETLWDTFHVLKIYRFKNRLLKTHMRMMIREKCQYNFQKMYLEAVEMARTEEEMDSIHEFMYKSNRYCMSQIPNVFVGFGVSNSQNEILNGVVKQKMPRQADYLGCVWRMLGIFEQRNFLAQTVIKLDNLQSEKISVPEIVTARMIMNKPAYLFLFNQLARTIHIQNLYYDDENKLYAVQDLNNVHLVEEVHAYAAKVLTHGDGNHIKNALKCTCKFQDKTGIPCEHVCKVILQTGRNLVDNIDQYYIIEGAEKMFKYRAYGKPNSMRSHIVRTSVWDQNVNSRVSYYMPEGMKVPRTISNYKVRQHFTMHPGYEATEEKLRTSKPQDKDYFFQEEQSDQSIESNPAPRNERQVKKRKELIRNYFDQDQF